MNPEDSGVPVKLQNHYNRQFDSGSQTLAGKSGGTRKPIELAPRIPTQKNSQPPTLRTPGRLYDATVEE